MEIIMAFKRKMSSGSTEVFVPQRKRRRKESFDEGPERKRRRMESFDEGLERKRRRMERKRRRMESFDEGPNRKRRRMESFDEGPSLHLVSPAPIGNKVDLTVEESCHLVRPLLQQDLNRLEKTIFHGWFKHQYDRVSEGNDSQERKSSFEKLPSFHSSDTLASPGQLQQVQNQSTERSTDDKNTWRTVTTGKKRKRSSHPDEGPARKRPRMKSVEVVSASSSCDTKGSSDQESYQNVVVDFIGLKVQPPANLPDILSRYQLGRILGKGGFGIVYEGKRLEDGLEVAVKIARKPRKMQYISIPGHPAPLPLEVALLILVNNREPKAAQIIQLLDWQDELDYYILVLERPLPCTDLHNFTSLFGGTLNEFGARLVMWQVTHAANACSASGVLHRDIKMENILINPQTLETKLIDFGCGDLLKKSAYDYFSGTREYRPPEFKREGRYHGNPATVWSLGVLLFRIVFGHFPGPSELWVINSGTWNQPGLSHECRLLIQCLLQLDPRQRICLEEILSHSWFQSLSL